MEWTSSSLPCEQRLEPKDKATSHLDSTGPTATLLSIPSFSHSNICPLKVCGEAKEGLDKILQCPLQHDIEDKQFLTFSLPTPIMPTDLSFE
jgi:hypothetical protein